MVRSLHSRQVIRTLHVMDEAECADRCRSMLNLSRKTLEKIRSEAGDLIRAVRKSGNSNVEAFLHEYSLSDAEGVALMNLAESLLRVPDAATRNALIREKLSQGRWAEHRGRSPSALVNASANALSLAEGVIDQPFAAGPLRAAMDLGIHALGRAFVMGETIDQAMQHARKYEMSGSLTSYDMLGEAAKTAEQADRYQQSYMVAIAAVGRRSAGRGPFDGPGVSVKLSALHPRFECLQASRVKRELTPRLLELCRSAKEYDIGLTVDAEESERLEIWLDVMEEVVAHPSLSGWDGLGMAVQAYQKRAVGVVDWAVETARAAGRRMVVRLVKGAYWDGEIKKSQERGLDSYPVFTVKAWTDLSYLACASILLDNIRTVRPAFATHNAVTAAAVQVLAEKHEDWEFQRLHGMGEALYAAGKLSRPCRIYAPVGPYKELLPYLVRRLLENGANASFVRHLADPDESVESLVDFIDDGIPLKPPGEIFLPHRMNSRGYDLCDGETIAALQGRISAWDGHVFRALPMVEGIDWGGREFALKPHFDAEKTIGFVSAAHGGVVDIAVNRAVDAFHDWNVTPPAQRAGYLDAAADVLESDPSKFLYLLIHEAGKTWPDALAEIREAVDFLRYYAAEARRLFETPVLLPNVTGEQNHLHYSGRGVFACVSPWNFPLAIFIGQIAAALAAGNTVVAKPAPQTSLIAAAAVELMHGVGVPPQVLGLLPGGDDVGSALTSHPDLAGVAFTGSHDAAKKIAQNLAAGTGPLKILIAETGGLNAMIADSTALLEQLTADVLSSAFLSAGQRCSALRVLFVHDDIAEAVFPMLIGAAKEMKVGRPDDFSVDVGPLIDEAAWRRLVDYDRLLQEDSRLLVKLPVPEGESGWYFAPRIYEIDWRRLPNHEVFGPILHVVRWKTEEFEHILKWLNMTGYGLTLGIHSRLDAFVQRVVDRARIGNIYVNRGMTGANVGCQPFGGMGLSGTGPKAGGPNTLLRFVIETTITRNLSAIGGDTTLLCGDAESG